MAERLGGAPLAQACLAVLAGSLPWSRQASLAATRVCAKKRWFDAATHIGERGLLRWPNANDLRLIVADSHLAARRFDAALRHARDLIGADPMGFDGFHIAGESLQQLGCRQESLEVLEQGLERCAEANGHAAQGRSRHVQRHLQAYLKRDWYPIYHLWRASVLSDALNRGIAQSERLMRRDLCLRPQSIQYWSQGEPPADVQALTARWDQLLLSLGLAPIQVFDKRSAREWIACHQADLLVAFDSAPHYAAESDVFRLAYAMGGDMFWLDSDLVPAEHAATVLALALRQHASLLFLKDKVPYLQSSAFIARAGCPFFAGMAESLRGFDYSAKQWSGVSRLHLIHDHSFGPATYVKALEALCLARPPVRPCHDQLPYLQQILFSDFRLSFFTGRYLVRGAGKNLAYKRSVDNWKLWARA